MIDGDREGAQRSTAGRVHQVATNAEWGDAKMQELTTETVVATFGAESPYLQGAFRPIDDEISVELESVLGSVPDDLAGMFVRNGSNPKYPPRGRYHWFDGDGMLHGVRFGERQAYYTNRYVRTPGLARETAVGEALYTGILEPPDFRQPGGPFKNTANTDLVFHDGRLLALWWLGGKAHRIRLPELDTMGEYDFEGRLRRGIASHPKVDPRTGDLVFFDYALTPPYLIHGVASADGSRLRQVPIELPGARLQHDMAITERYSIVLDLPMYWDPKLLAQGKQRVMFDRAMPARFGILPRWGEAETIRWFEAPACYIYHTINAYEEGETVVLTGCSIDNPLAPEHRSAGPWPKLDIIELEPYLARWIFNLRTGQTTHELLDDVPTEFPRMNDGYKTQSSRYSYNPRIAREPALLFDGLIKYDHQRGTSQAISYGPGCFGGEVSFAPRPEATAEDDGYLITFVVDARDGKSEVWVIDAAEFDAGPIVRLRVPQRVPIGYHTCWVSADALARQQ